MIHDRCLRRRTKQRLSTLGSAAALLMLALPIFPDRLQSSIVGRSELNFRVRNGNGWTLALISTNCYNGFAPSFIRHIVPSKPNKEKMGQAWRLPAYRRSSPRAISTGQLHTLLRFHLRPIKQVVCLCPYSLRMSGLILGGVSRLDAFSVYLVRT